jgi:type IV pilus assembly protein PilA
MLTRLNAAREDREAGFTLIELLVVVAIIGILAAIAIPLFLSQRDNAAVSGGEAEVKNAATQIEVFYTENGSYPADLDTAGVNSSAGVSMNYATADGAYTLYATITEADGCAVVWDPASGTFGTTAPAGTTLC